NSGFMSTAVAAGRRVLPRGYADFARQLLIWFGFVFAYQLARGLADRNPSKAFVDGWRILDFEQRVTNHVFELTLQQFAISSSVPAADALIVGLVLASLVRRPAWKVLWLVWPLWVCFAVMATGNHFWLDVLAGIALGSAAMYIVYRRPVQRLIARLL